MARSSRRHRVLSRRIRRLVDSIPLVDQGDHLVMTVSASVTARLERLIALRDGEA